MERCGPGKPVPETFEDLVEYVGRVRENNLLATNMMLKGMSIATEPYEPFHVTGMYPSPRSGFTLGHQVRRVLDCV